MTESEQKAATMALGWAWAEACTQLDRGDDPRQWEVPELLERMLKELADD